MTVQMADEVRIGLGAQTANQAASMVKTKLEPMLAEKAESFNKDTHFQEAVGQALKTKRSVELAMRMVEDKMYAPGLAATIARIEPLQGNVVDLTEMALGDDGADLKVVVAWMCSVPSGLTRLKVDVSKVSGEVVTALHGLVAQTMTLVDLDAMEKDAPNLNVLQLNGTEEVKALDFSSKKLGPVSAAIIAACIQRNSVLESLQCALHIRISRIHYTQM